MKVRVLKEYVGRNSGKLHKVGEEENWGELGKYSKGLIDNGFVKVIEEDDSNWAPGIMEKYYSPVFPDGTIYFGLIAERHIAELGLAFGAKEESDRMTEWLKAVKVLRQDSEESTRGGKIVAPYSVWYNVEGLEVDHFAVSFTRKTARNNPFSFSSIGDVERSIVDHRKEWLTFFGVSG